MTPTNMKEDFVNDSENSVLIYVEANEIVGWMIKQSCNKICFDV